MDTIKDTTLNDEYLVDIQLAENEEVSEDDSEYNKSGDTCEDKRKLLKKTRIVRQTWSISEIYQKIQKDSLYLDPVYQRQKIWKKDKQTAFIESLYMGIIVPPIYVVETSSKDVLKPNTYEVVDGKQRLTAIMEFLNGKLQLVEKSLEYYTDWFGGRKFEQIREEHEEETNEMLSSVLDIYVITSNSPEFTKYDIFSRLNKGAEKLKVNEIRKAIYRSDMLRYIEEYVNDKVEKEDMQYFSVFTPNDIKRYEDFGRFFKSIAFYVRSDIKKGVVNGYNSRPREMINDVLHDIQQDEIVINDRDLQIILDSTIELEELLQKESGRECLIDAMIPFVVEGYDVKEKLHDVLEDNEIKQTFVKSATTTTNVNKRLKRVKELLEI